MLIESVSKGCSYLVISFSSTFEKRILKPKKFARMAKFGPKFIGWPKSGVIFEKVALQKNSSLPVYYLTQGLANS